MILACTVLIQSTSVTDRQTDGQTDGQTPRRWQRRAKHSAFARDEIVWRSAFLLLSLSVKISIRIKTEPDADVQKLADSIVRLQKNHKKSNPCSGQPTGFGRGDGRLYASMESTHGWTWSMPERKNSGVTMEREAIKLWTKRTWWRSDRARRRIRVDYAAIIHPPIHRPAPPDELRLKTAFFHTLRRRSSSLTLSIVCSRYTLMDGTRRCDMTVKKNQQFGCIVR